MDYGNICVYFYNEDIVYDFRRPEKTYLLSRSLVINNMIEPVTSIGYGTMNGGKNPNKVVKGHVTINNNPVIREVICLNKYNQEIARTVSNVADGYFEIKTGNINEEVFCVAVDPKISSAVICSAVDTEITLFFCETNKKIVQGAKYPVGLPQNCLTNTILKIENEELLVTNVSFGSGLTQYNIPRAITVTVQRGFNNTTAVDHDTLDFSANCHSLDFNHVSYAHQLGA